MLPGTQEIASPRLPDTPECVSWRSVRAIRVLSSVTNGEGMLRRSGASDAWRRGFVAIALAAVCVPSVAFGQGSPGLDPGRQIGLQIERGRFLSALPFDVQFFLLGDAPDDLVGARGRFANLTRAVRDCKVALPADETTTPPAGVNLRMIPETIPFPDNGKRQFELSVDSLEPNKEYCFIFVLLYKADAAEMLALVADAIDATMRAVVVESLGDLEAYNRFRRNLRDAIEIAAKRKSEEKGFTIRPVFPADTFFGAADLAGINQRYQEEFRQTVQSQGNKGRIVTQLTGQTATARNVVRRLATDASLARLMQQLNSRSTDPSVKPLLDGLGGAAVLASQSTSALDAAAFGLPGGDAAVLGFDRVWLPSEVAERQKNLTARIQEFEQLASVARTLRQTPALRALTGLTADALNGLTDAQLDALAMLADDTAESFEAVKLGVDSLATTLTSRQAEIRRMAQQVAAEVARDIRFAGNTIAEWETRAKQYIGLDVGFANSSPIDSTFFYLGTNIYTGPVNKKAPLPWSDQSFRKRFAFMVGIPLNPFEEGQTTNQFANAPQKLEGIIGDRPLLTGAGWRLTDIIRLAGGIVMFRIKDPNPLVDTKPERKFTWFISLSTDWDLKGMFSGLAGPPQPPR